jgi:hypothetical protein
MSMAVEHLPEILSAYITRTHHAMTIAQRTCIGQHIVDARIIAATASAAHWYGMDSPAQLLGKWISLLHHPDDARLGRVLSLARHCGLKAPTAYVSRIWQADVPGTFRPVQKDTTQMTVDGESYWVTVLLEPGPEDVPLALHPEVFRRFAVPDAQLAARFYGQMSVAELEAALAAGDVQRVSPFAASPVPPHRMLNIALGETVLLAEGVYAHRCARCTEIWVTRNPAPVRCGKRNCQALTWREFAKPLQGIQQEGTVITPRMVRAARKPRTSRRTARQAQQEAGPDQQADLPEHSSSE